VEVENRSGTELLGHVIRECLRKGFPVAIDGLGTFRLNGAGGLEFVSSTAPRVFVAYVVEDLPKIERLCDALIAAGFDPWLDRRKLMPGQDWPRAIDRAVSVSDFVVPCFSRRALRKRGQFQRELRLALEHAGQTPLDDVMLMPVRLEECDVPRRIRASYQYVDLFPDWDGGVHRLIEAIRTEVKAREKRR
jgi:hypothetical protein